MPESVGFESFGWRTDRDRTRLAIADDSDALRITCWDLTSSGRFTTPLPTCIFSYDRKAGWELLGWASSQLLVLWRKVEDGSELRILDIAQSATRPRHLRLMGRPIECQVVGERLEVLVAISDGTQALLFLYRADLDSYLLVESDGELRRAEAWDAAERIFAATFQVDSPFRQELRLFTYDDENCVEFPVDWPGSVRPSAACGLTRGLLGLTGVDPSGVTIPGVLELSTRSVRWFDDRRGWTCVDLSPGRARMLTVGWQDGAFAYQVGDLAGSLIAEVTPEAGLASDVRLTSNGEHLIGEYQSPVRQPAIHLWAIEDPSRPDGRVGTRLWPHSVGAPVCDAQWRLEWTDDGDLRIPEWVFEPVGGGNEGTVLFLHGGPGGQLTQSYDPVLANLLRAGWRVVGMNYPGSAGYGSQFEALSRADWGGVDACAIEWRLRALVDEAGQRPVCLYGQSYGAYLALLVAASSPGIADGVAVWSPVTDLPLLLEQTTGVQRKWLDGELGELRFDVEQLRARSPIERSEVLSRLPLLIGHGRFDDRCPVEQSRRLVEKLREPLYLEDPDGRHAPSNWQWWAEAVVAHFSKGIRETNTFVGGDRHVSA